MKQACIVRLDALGDTLLSTPAVRLLQTRYPGCRVTMLTSPVGSAVVRDLCDSVSFSGQASSAEIAKALRDLQPDAVFCFTEKRRAVSAVRASGAPLRVGFDPGWSQPLKSLALRFSLTHRLPFPNDLEGDPGLHEVERYLEQVALLGERLHESERGPLLLHLRPDEQSWAEAWMQEQQQPRPQALQLTPKWSLHGAQPEQLRQLIQSLRGGWIGFCGPGEREWAQQHFSDLLPLWCQDDLHRYAALLQRCRLLVTVDTGAAHVAAAVGTPLVDVFPELHNAHCTRRWRPWKVNHRLVASDPLRQDRLREDIGKAVEDLATHES